MRQTTLGVSLGAVRLVLPTCDGRFEFGEVASDRAGNITAAPPIPIVCDDTAPTVAWRPSLFTPQRVAGYTANTITFVGTAPIDLTATQSATIRIYANHFYPGSQLLPIINSVATDYDGRPAFGTRAEDLVTHYRYSRLRDGVWSVVRDWTQHDGHSLVLSPATLDAEAARAGPDILHRVEVRARDEAGLNGTATFDFHLDVVPVPLVLSGCQTADGLRSFSLNSGNLHELYTGGDVAVARAKIYWPVAAPVTEESLAARMSGASLMTSIHATRVAKTDVGQWRYAGQVQNYDWSCSGGEGHSLEESLLDAPRHCRDGFYQEDEAAWTRPSNCTGLAVSGLPCRLARSYRWMHEARFRVEPEGGGPAAVGGNEGVDVQIAPDRYYDVTVYAVTPRIELDGAPYSWPTLTTARGTRYVVGEGGGYDLRTRELWEYGRNYDARWFSRKTYISQLVLSVGALTATAFDASRPHAQPQVFVSGDCERIGPFRAKDEGGGEGP